jgi:hypothetical protein
MSYMVVFYNPRSPMPESSKECESIAEVRRVTAEFVDDRMAAFGDDREALRRYGFIEASEKALDMDVDGGSIHLQDGWKLEVIPREQD